MAAAIDRLVEQSDFVCSLREEPLYFCSLVQREMALWCGADPRVLDDGFLSEDDKAEFLLTCRRTCQEYQEAHAGGWPSHGELKSSGCQEDSSS
jgi:hypothetical protein